LQRCDAVPERLDHLVHFDELRDLVQRLRVAVRVSGSDEVLVLLTRMGISYNSSMYLRRQGQPTRSISLLGHNIKP
jgi:hypothetical protein